ncbi:MAG TPA: glycerol-3-phosphate 1-O-acyltransferase PlsY [Stellaceae bacterium]|nr:glycerol-3-phosphate 1-O-acyltransferase PlsY [Stellaceae bacterium]
MNLLAAIAIGYLLGSIPFGLLLTRLAGLGDVRKIGSGSIGATNVLRTGNKAVAALTLVCDVGKGVAAVLIGASWGVHAELAAGAAVVVGHVFPVWLGFRGGKGVATSLGVVAAVVWPVALVGGLVWLATAVIFRYSSLAALVATAVAAAYAAFIVDGEHELLIAGIAILVIAKHHENIHRLLVGTESRISLSKG